MNKMNRMIHPFHPGTLSTLQYIASNFRSYVCNPMCCNFACKLSLPDLRRCARGAFRQANQIPSGKLIKPATRIELKDNDSLGEKQCIWLRLSLLWLMSLLFCCCYSTISTYIYVMYLYLYRERDIIHFVCSMLLIFFGHVAEELGGWKQVLGQCMSWRHRWCLRRDQEIKIIISGFEKRSRFLMKQSRLLITFH